MADILITQGHNGGAVSAKVGDTVTIELPETPTTGFRWTLATSALSGLAMVEDGFQLRAQSAVGGGGVHTWRFASQRPGTTHLEFRLVRSWQADTPKSVFRVQVQVR
jgi:inhibitor of cysteine peptidase